MGTAQISGIGATINLGANSALSSSVYVPASGLTFVIQDSTHFTAGTGPLPPSGVIGPQGGNAGNLALAAGGQSFTPAYSRAYDWDTEQLWFNTPWGERIVAEGRLGNRATNGDNEVSINRPVSSGGSSYLTQSGNPTPQGTYPGSGTNAFGPGGSSSPYSYSSAGNNGVASGQQEIVSGTSYALTIHYNAVTNLLSYTQGPTTITHYATSDGTASGTKLDFSRALLRVNVSPFAIAPISPATSSTRTMAVSDLFFQLLDASQNPSGAPIAMNSDVSGTNSLIATATSTGTSDRDGQRQYTLYTHSSLNQSNSFRITGNYAFTWSGSAPNGSNMAFQFKFGEGISMVPEPSQVAAIVGLIGLGIAMVVRRRR